MEFTAKIADLTVGISCTHALTRVMCEEYLTEEAPMFHIEASEEHQEKLRNYFQGFSEVFSDDYIESLTLYDSFCGKILAYDAAAFHAALISFDGEGVAFAAPSGTGKTTHIRLWQQLYGARVEVINGDKPVFTFRNGAMLASGMPWCGKEGWSFNKTVPLRAVCFIDRAPQNSIELMTDNGSKMHRLFEQLMMPDDEGSQMIQYLDFANKLINTVPFYLLRCNMELDAAQTAHDGIFGIEQ